MNAKVRDFLSEIVSNTVVLSTHCCRIEATPFDVAHALRLFAEDGPKFVFDYSSDGHNVWRLDPTEEGGEQEDLDLNVTESLTILATSTMTMMYTPVTETNIKRIA